MEGGREKYRKLQREKEGEEGGKARKVTTAKILTFAPCNLQCGRNTGQVRALTGVTKMAENGLKISQK